MAGPDNLGAFTVQPVSLGRVDAVTPSSIPAGTRTVVSVSGRDIATAAFPPPEVATRSIIERRSDLVRIALTPTVTQTRIQLPLGETVGGQYVTWRTLEVAIQSTVATGDTGCQPMATGRVADAPTPESPANGFVFDPLTSTQTQRQVTFRWTRPGSATSLSDSTYIFEHRVATGAWTTRTIAALTTQINLARARYEWRVRSLNCGQPSTYSPTWTFEVR